ncbi:MAG: hypothetical protein WCI11_09115 [Candidatus Methylumidiphilus sp.]
MALNKFDSDRRNPYISKDGKPMLKDSVVAFVDILGYKELVCQEQKNGRSQELLLELHQKLSQSFYQLDGLRDNGEPIFETVRPDQMDFHKIRTFSDNIVIGYPINQFKHMNQNYVKGMFELDSLFSNLALFQLHMVNQGLFVRGAITVGELYIDDLIIFGQALIDAYNAEKEEARDPRIILTKSAEKMIDEHDSYYQDQPKSNYMLDLYKDSDKKLFLNYLQSLLIGDYDEQFVQSLEDHKNMVEKKLSEYPSQPKIWSMYAWVANYHNYFCDQHFDDEYKVDMAQYQMQPTRIK